MSKWEKIRAERTADRPDIEAEINRQKLLLELAELRERRGVSQTAIAEELDVSQPNVHRIEKERDVKLSTLVNYVEALGGTVEIKAIFDDDQMPLTAAIGRPLPSTRRAPAQGASRPAKQRKTTARVATSGRSSSRSSKSGRSTTRSASTRKKAS